MKVIDFGTSDFCPTGQRLFHKFGTPLYVAPEVTSGLPKPAQNGACVHASGLQEHACMSMHYAPAHMKETCCSSPMSLKTCSCGSMSQNRSELACPQADTHHTMPSNSSASRCCLSISNKGTLGRGHIPGNLLQLAISPLLVSSSSCSCTHTHTG